MQVVEFKCSPRLILWSSTRVTAVFINLKDFTPSIKVEISSLRIKVNLIVSYSAISFFNIVGKLNSFCDFLGDWTKCYIVIDRGFSSE
jgi:hypothetical protein